LHGCGGLERVRHVGNITPFHRRARGSTVGWGDVRLEEQNALIMRMRLACAAALEVMWCARLKIIGLDALPWQVSRRDSMRL
jgi:hypothetical protein